MCSRIPSTLTKQGQSIHVGAYEVGTQSSSSLFTANEGENIHPGYSVGLVPLPPMF